MQVVQNVGGACNIEKGLHLRVKKRMCIKQGESDEKNCRRKPSSNPFLHLPGQKNGTSKTSEVEKSENHREHGPSPISEKQMILGGAVTAPNK